MLEIDIYKNMCVLSKPASDDLSSCLSITITIFTMNYCPMENGPIGDVVARMVPY